MRHKLCLLTLILSVTTWGQKEAKCVVTMSSGTEITGELKKFYPNIGPPARITLYNEDKRIRLYAQNMDQVIINDTLKYKSLANKKGSKMLMTPLVEGKPLSLYSHSSVRTGNLPGEGFSSWIYTEFYMLSGEGEPVFINERKLIKKPEDFFPDTPALQDSIRGIKRDDLIIKNLVIAYNEIKSMN
ncbi:MAG: hypothetical protein AAFY00_10275 [Bacteroidota bacterium]